MHYKRQAPTLLFSKPARFRGLKGEIRRLRPD
jgi:hypothetical protein